MKISFRLLHKIDLVLLIAVFLLIIIGLLNIYSMGLSSIETKMIFFNKQLAFALTGLILLLSFTVLDYRFLKSYHKIFLILSVILLLVVVIFGRSIRGASAWISLFGFRFQPVELVKISLIIFLATYLSNTAKEFYHSWKPIIVSGAVSFLMIFLVLLQPDMGSAIILFVIWFMMIFFTNIDKKKVMIISLLVLIVLSFGWFGFLKDYQKERIVTFLNPEADPLGVGYNLSQSIIAVGSGQFTGRGFGLGSQSQLNFLPEQRTDFIYAVISEEFGFLGSALVIIIIAVFLYKIITIIKKSSDNFAVFLALGFLIMFFFQSMMNIAMNLGIAPVIGLPLPFVSYGGSSMWMSLIAVGILESIVIHKTEFN
jgi:rod shape determining protein RodA